MFHIILLVATTIMALHRMWKPLQSICRYKDLSQLATICCSCPWDHYNNVYYCDLSQGVIKYLFRFSFWSTMTEQPQLDLNIYYDLWKCFSFCLWMKREGIMDADVWWYTMNNKPIETKLFWLYVDDVYIYILIHSTTRPTMMNS